jgi:hypothetical protein
MRDTLNKSFDTIVGAATLVIVLLIAYAGWRAIQSIAEFFSPDLEFDQFTWAQVEGAETNDELATGFLAIDTLWIDRDGQSYSLIQILRRTGVPQPLLEEIYGEPDSGARRGSITYCAHSYEIVVGYPSFAAFRRELEAQPASPADAAFPLPGILALDIKSSRASPTETTAACMQKNLSQAQAGRERTQQEILDIMEYDGVKELHMKQAQLSAVTLVDSITGACAATPVDDDDAGNAPISDDRGVCWGEILAGQWELEAAGGPDLEPTRSFGQAVPLAFADAAGIGAVQITISTLFGMDTAWRPWYWFDRQGVYLQRDVTKIVYGSSVSPIAAIEPRSVLGERATRIVLRRPSELSRDRRTSFALQTGRSGVWDRVAEQKDQNLAAYVTGEINAAVDGAERSIHDRAIVSAEVLIRQRVMNWFGGRVSVEFRAAPGSADEPPPLIPTAQPR